MIRRTAAHRLPRAATLVADRGHVGSERGAATLELVLVAVPVLLALLVAIAACGRLTTAHAAVGAVARDAARAAATAASGDQAVQLGLQQASRTSAGLDMDPGRLTVAVNPGAFDRGGVVQVTAAYRVTFADLPVSGGASLGITVTEHQAEIIDPYRSR